MNNNYLHKMKKGIALGLVTVLTMVSTAIPVLADKTQQPRISQWAVGTLNEGEKYGIYPMRWYEDGFLEAISADKQSVLLANVEVKLSELELEKDESFVPINYEQDGTRGSMLTGLYNSLAAYKLPEELEKDKSNAIEYLQKRRILNGTSKGLELEGKCTVEQAAVLATKVIEDTYGATGAGAKGLMWKVQQENNTVYLLGSIHTGYTGLYPINKKVKDIFSMSDVLIVEANIFDQKQEELEEYMALAKYSDGTKLQDHISEETYEKLVGFLDEMGLPVDVYDNYKPWIIANELTMMMATDSDTEEVQDGAQFGIDMYFLSTGMLAGKPVIELESIIQQGHLFDDISPEVQEEQLSGLLDMALDPEAGGSSDVADIINIWLEQWYEGDIDGFKSTFVKAGNEPKSEYEEALFGKRDQAMTEKLIKILEDDGEATYFVVVGAGHFTEKDTVVDLLRSKGYTVERFWK